MENYLESKKLNGGMINSAGITQQDLAAIKYLFDNIDDGVSGISFETDEDFVLHYNDGTKLLCQSKINLLTVPFVKSLESKIVPKEKTHVLMGTGVNIEQFSLLPYPKDSDETKILFVARVMKEKGVTDDEDKYL